MWPSEDLQRRKAPEGGTASGRGLSRQQARQYLPGTADRAVEEEFGVRGDEASGVWGTDELPPDLT